MADKNRGPKKARKQKQTNPTDYFTTPLTRKGAKQQARLQARLATRDASRELQAERRAAKQQIKQDAGYFDQYAQTIPVSAQKAADATSAAITQINQTGSGAAAYAEQLRQRLAQEGQADAALRGATYNAGADHTDAQAQLSRLDSSGILANVTAAQGASTQGLLAARGDSAAREKVAQRLRDVARKHSIDSDQRALAAKKGDIKRQEFTDIIGRERDFALGQQAAALNARGQRIDARQTRRQQNLTARDQRIRERLQAQSQAETRRHNLASESHADQTEARLRRQDRFDRRHPNHGEKPSENPHAPDSADVNHALAVLNQTKPGFFDGKSVQDVVDALLVKDQTLTRKEATIAVKRWFKQHAHAF